MNIEVRFPVNVSDFHLCEELQRRAWGTSSPVPAHMLIAGYRNGGLLLMAFDGNKAVGFCFDLLGRNGSTTYLYNHMLGVIPEAQSRGVGYLLKLKEREYALRMGFNLIKWTYDPLQSRNAALYVGKLGAICNEYQVNYYGEMSDSLNAGYDSDRFIAEWWLNSQHVVGRIEKASRRLTLGEVSDEIPSAIESKVIGCVRGATRVNLNLESEVILVEIPWDIVLIKQLDPKLAVEWRVKTRAVFQEYLSRGYSVTDFAVEEDEKRSFYILSKNGKHAFSGGLA